MQENVFKPLGMTNTRPEYHSALIPNRARYYKRDKRHMLKNSPYVDMSCKWAGGGFVSTVEVDDHLNNKLMLSRI
jgi:serine beta-lactamase-like protein LACTB